MATGGDSKPSFLKAIAGSSLDHPSELLYGLVDTVTHKDVNCMSCQRRGQKSKAKYYCRDCNIGLCCSCSNEHSQEIKMNRHSLSVISKTFHVSPNQGPFPEMTEIGTIKLDQEYFIRGSTFLPNGELAVSDYTNSRIRVFSADYTRKPITNFLIPKQNKWDEKRPKPMDIATVSRNTVAFTADNGCIYIVSTGSTMVMSLERVISVINFDSNFGECLGLEFNNADDNLYVGCSSDREGTYIKIYGLDGELKRTVREDITTAPEFLCFGTSKIKLYAADSDTVKVYDVHDFSVAEEYIELQAQTRDIFVDKYGYLYTLALERRTFDTPGSIYRLNPVAGVTKVISLNERPASISYCMATDDVAVTFVASRYIYLFKLKLRTFPKYIRSDLKQYD